MSEQDEKIFRLIDQLMSATSDPGEIHVCPICGGSLHVRFQPYTRGSKAMLGVQAFCESCGIAVAVDAARPPLKWLEKRT
jgi:hypothetical protein